jgi:hypothetical protein
MTPNFTAFSEELTKIANHWVRSGRRPISVDKFLENEATDNSGPGPNSTPEFEAKTSAVIPLAIGAVGGALALHHGKKAVKDWRLGRDVRQQQEAQGGY